MLCVTDFKLGWKTAALRPLSFSMTALSHLSDPPSIQTKGEVWVVFRRCCNYYELWAKAVRSVSVPLEFSEWTKCLCCRVKLQKKNVCTSVFPGRVMRCVHCWSWVRSATPHLLTPQMPPSKCESSWGCHFDSFQLLIINHRLYY